MPKVSEMLSLEDKLKLIHLKQSLIPKRRCSQCRELTPEDDCPVCGYKALRENSGRTVHIQAIAKPNMEA